MARDSLGLALVEVGRVEEAISAHREGLAIYRETGDRHGEGASLNNLGLALAEAGRVEEAISAHQDAAAIYRETGDRYREGTALNNLERDRARRDVMAAGRLRETDEPGIRTVSVNSIDPPGDMRGWQAADWATKRVRSDPLEDRPQRRRRRPVAAWAIGGLLAVSVAAGVVYEEATGNSANVPVRSPGAAQPSSPGAPAKAGRPAASSPGPSATASSLRSASVAVTAGSSGSASSSPGPSASASSSPSATAGPSASQLPTIRASVSLSASSAPSL
jgi:hypothetical protein